MITPEALPATAVPAAQKTEPRASATPVPGPVCCGSAQVCAASMCLSADHTPFVPRGFRENLFTRTLSDIVNKEDFVLGSEYLVTLLVIVPK